MKAVNTNRKTQKIEYYDAVVIGAGIVGLCTAYNLMQENCSLNILIIDKEDVIGKRTSGRNSGVIHAGIYYKPSSLKAKVCIEGGRELKECLNKKNLPINNCGKLIIPTTNDQEDMLEMLRERGASNGANCEIINRARMDTICSSINQRAKYALWSPDTSIVSPRLILDALMRELKEKGVKCIPENGPVLYPQSNGTIQRGIPDIMKDMLHFKHSSTIPSSG